MRTIKFYSFFIFFLLITCLYSCTIYKRNHYYKIIDTCDSIKVYKIVDKQLLLINNYNTPYLMIHEKEMLKTGIKIERYTDIIAFKKWEFYKENKIVGTLFEGEKGKSNLFTFESKDVKFSFPITYYFASP